MLYWTVIIKLLGVILIDPYSALASWYFQCDEWKTKSDVCIDVVLREPLIWKLHSPNDRLNEVLNSSFNDF